MADLRKAPIPANGEWTALKEAPVVSIIAPTLPSVQVDIDDRGIGWVRNSGSEEISVEYEVREPANG